VLRSRACSHRLPFSKQHCQAFSTFGLQNKLHCVHAMKINTYVYSTTHPFSWQIWAIKERCIW
jgi:hypothetical protein